MAGLLSKIALISALAPMAWVVPSATLYTRPEAPTTTIVAEITSYNSEPGQTDDTPDITASGLHVHDGTIACPTRYAFGTQVEIAGRTYTCEDRMNQRLFPERFDIWMASSTESREWGIQTLQVVIK